LQWGQSRKGLQNVILFGIDRKINSLGTNRLGVAREPDACNPQVSAILQHKRQRIFCGHDSPELKKHDPQHSNLQIALARGGYRNGASSQLNQHALSVKAQNGLLSAPLRGSLIKQRQSLDQW
jgi:hypothetical protein